MPPYDCMLLFKPNVKKEALISLVARIGKHVCRRNGVVTEVKSFGTVQLGYGVKKLDGRFFQVSVTVIVPCVVMRRLFISFIFNLVSFSSFFCSN